MKVQEILAHKGGDVMTVQPTETVGTLSHRLRMARVGALIVSEDGVHMKGIVSERDIVGCVAEHGAEALGKPVSSIMSARVVTCTASDNISSIARIMTENRVRHVPVLDGGRLVGVVSIGDIVKHRLDEVELESRVLRDLAIAGH